MKPEIRRLAQKCLSEETRDYFIDAIENALEILLPSQRNPKNYEYRIGSDTERLDENYELFRRTSLGSILKGLKDDKIRRGDLGRFLDVRRNPNALENQVLMALAKTSTETETVHYADENTRAAHSFLEDGFRRDALRYAKRAAETKDNLEKFKELQSEYPTSSPQPATLADYQTLITRKFDSPTYTPDPECPRWDVEPSKTDLLTYFNRHGDKDIMLPQDRIDACIEIFESYRAETAKNAVLAGALAYIRGQRFELVEVPGFLREIMDRIGAVDEKELREKASIAVAQKASLEYVFDSLGLGVETADMTATEMERKVRQYLQEQEKTDRERSELRRVIENIKRLAGIEERDDKTLLHFMRFLRLQKDKE